MSIRGQRVIMSRNSPGEHSLFFGFDETKPTAHLGEELAYIEAIYIHTGCVVSAMSILGDAVNRTFGCTICDVAP